jgi:hypothetical protein
MAQKSADSTVYPVGIPISMAKLRVCIPSGKLTVCELEHDPVEIVDLAMKNDDFP